MSIPGNKSHRKLGSLSASAFAALLVLAAAAPTSAQSPRPPQHNDGGSVGSAPSSNHSAGGGSSRSGSGSSYSGGGSSQGGGSTSSSWHGDRGGGGRGEGRGGGRGGYGRGGGRHGGSYGGHRGHGHRYGGYGYYGGWGGYYGGWGGYWPWWYPGYGGPTIIVERDRYGYGYDNGGGSGALDLDLTPESAQIFIDGEYVGQADDYDGFPTFLWLRSGTYDVAFYAPGYQTIVRQYTLRPGVVIDVEDRMTPGESIPPEELMTPKSTEVRDARIRRNEEQNAEVDRMEAEMAERDSRGGGSSQEVGRISLSVWPPDSAIYLDGHFLGTSEEIGQLSAGLVVEPGEHELEVVRPGYGTIRRTVNVTAGEKSEVKLDLEKN